MSDARWFEVDSDVAAATEHFARSVEIFAAGGFSGDDLAAYRARMGFMHAMQSGHTSLESAVVRIMGLLCEDVPSGAEWHADLVRRARQPLRGRPAILTPPLALAMDETRRFRHVAMRSYGTFEVTRASPAVTAAAALAAGLGRVVAEFRAVVDPG